MIPSERVTCWSGLWSKRLEFTARSRVFQCRILPQLDRFPMRRMTISVGPCFLSFRQGRHIGQTFACDQTLEGRQPVFVIMGSVVRLTTVCRGLEFRR